MSKDIEKRMEEISIREKKASKPWKSMRDGNQYINPNPYKECHQGVVGASRVEGLPRVWSPWGVGFSEDIKNKEYKLENISRFTDEDADFIANAREDIPWLLQLCDQISFEKDFVEKDLKKAVEFLEESPTPNTTNSFVDGFISYYRDKNPKEGPPKKTSPTEKLAHLLDDMKMQVTFTGWKAELETCEKELNKAKKVISEVALELVETEEIIRTELPKFSKLINNLRKKLSAVIIKGINENKT